jgi:Fe-S oxidoreductase
MCNNNGARRKRQGGAMCPSYRVTHDEQHVTRGRANSLRLALSGQLGPEAMASDAMAETMKLCVGCKACKRECPTGVDMARMKIEVQAARRRTHGPSWRRHRFTAPAASGPAGGPELVLWADSFNAAFEPETLTAALAVLTAAGYRATRQPRPPPALLRPPLPGARHPPDRPRTLLPAHLPRRAARPAAQPLGRPRRRQSPAARPLPPETFGTMGTIEATLRLIPGLAVETIDSTRCGMAGAFSYQTETVEISRAMAAQNLLPAIRAADPTTILVADGTSCRHQIKDGSNREAVHVAHVLATAMQV